MIQSKLGLLFCLFGFCLVPISSDAEQKIASEVTTDASKSIVVEVKQPQFTINLPANATTGYRWILLDDVAKRFSSIHEKYQAPVSENLGAGGMSIWHFKLSPSAFRYPHMIQLHFIYARPWDVSSHDIAATEQKVFNVVIANTTTD